MANANNAAPPADKPEKEKRTTKAAIRKHPLAVVWLAFDKKEPDVVAASDFHWFDGADALDEYFGEAANWAAEDVADNGDVFWSLVKVLNTADPMKVGTISTFGGDDNWRDEVRKSIEDDPDFVFVKQVKAKPKAAGPVKGRKKGAAAAKVAKPAAKGATPKAPVTKAKQRLAKKATKVAARAGAADAKPEAEAKAPAPKARKRPDRAAVKKAVAAKQPAKAATTSPAQAFVKLGGKRKV